MAHLRVQDFANLITPLPAMSKFSVRNSKFELRPVDDMPGASWFCAELERVNHVIHRDISLSHEATFFLLTPSLPDEGTRFEDVLA